MAAPVPDSVAAEILDALTPMLYADADAPQNNALAIFVNALCEPTLQEVEDYASDDPTTGAIGYSAWVDIDRAPDKALPWLAQFVGVKLTGGLTPTQQRQQIEDLANLNRATLPAFVAAAKPFLTGTKAVILRERFGSAYRLSVVTYLSQTPVEDWPTTNLLINGGFESNTTGWAGVGGATISRDTTVSRFGGASLKTVTPATSGTGPQFTSVAVTVGRKYALSAYVLAPVGQSLSLTMDWRNGSTPIFSNSTAFVGTGQWQRVTVTGIAPATATNVRPLININTATVVTFWTDGVQVEDNPAASPYVETNGATASRSSGNGPVGAALLSQKPAGIVMTYTVLAGQDYQLLLTNHATYALIYSSYTTYNGIVNDAPGA